MLIIDGKTKTKYCGTTGPQAYESQSNNGLKVIFKSNKKQEHQGFSCEYESITGKHTTTKAPTTPSTTISPTSAKLLEDAISNFNLNKCDNPQPTCECSGFTYADSEFYTTIIGDYRILATNGIPNHIYEVGQQKPNSHSACKHEVYMTVPKNPVKTSTYSEYGMGPIGFAISGGFFYNHLSSPQGAVSVFYDYSSYDNCNGHSDLECRYHYHAIPRCIKNGSACDLVGYMRDGFPVYSFCAHETKNRLLKSCYYLTSGNGSHSQHFTFSDSEFSAGNCDLDRANGYTFSDGYAYIFTEDYPYIMAGYYGSEVSGICNIY